MKKQNPYLGSTLSEHIAQLRRDDPHFAPRFDAEVERLALARQLRALREKRGLTQAQLAKRAGLLQPNVARLEAGRLQPGLDMLRRIAAAMNLRVAVEFRPARPARAG